MVHKSKRWWMLLGIVLATGARSLCPWAPKGNWREIHDIPIVIDILRQKEYT